MKDRTVMSFRRGYCRSLFNFVCILLKRLYGKQNFYFSQNITKQKSNRKCNFVAEVSFRRQEALSADFLLINRLNEERLFKELDSTEGTYHQKTKLIFRLNLLNE